VFTKPIHAHSLIITAQPRPDDVDGGSDLATLLSNLDELSARVSMLGDMVAAFRNHDDLLVSELRHHNLDVPGPSSSDPRFQRALRAIHELEPMPACIMPHPVTGE